MIMCRSGLLCAIMVAVLSLRVTRSLPTPDHHDSKHLDEHQLSLKEHYEHLAYVDEFKCHVPQPRTIAIHHLISEHQRNGKAFFPDVTVLHRCDEGSGCCTSGHQCGPVHSEYLRLPFKITFLENMEHHKKGGWAMEYHFMENHTECGCLDHEARHEHLLELKHHYEHIEYISEHKCHTPQPRTVPVHHLFSEEETHGKAFFPDVTVLHRCDEGSGSCTSGHCCRPEHTDHIELPFKVTFLEDSEHHKKGSWLIKYYALKNHTLCACLPEENIPFVKPPVDDTPNYEHSESSPVPTSTDTSSKPSSIDTSSKPSSTDTSSKPSSTDTSSKPSSTDDTSSKQSPTEDTSLKPTSTDDSSSKSSTEDTSSTDNSSTKSSTDDTSSTPTSTVETSSAKFGQQDYPINF